MASVFLREQKTNVDPIEPGFFQEWHFLDVGGPESAAFLISAIADSAIGQSYLLTVEDVRVETTRTGGAEFVPIHTLHFHVRNVGSVPIEKYFVNVWIIAP